MAVAPLDVVKIRFQVQPESATMVRYRSTAHAIRHIATMEGPLALWKGNVPALLMVVPYAALQFASFHQLKQFDPLPLAQPYRDLSYGAVSGAVATVAVYPLDLLRTVLAAQPEPREFGNMVQAARGIYARRGVSGLYAGLGPTLVEIVPYVSVQFAMFEYAKRLIVAQKHPDVPSLAGYESLVLGGTVGTIAKLSTLPLDNAKKRMQIQGQLQMYRDPRNSAGSDRYRGTFDVLRRIYLREGIRGWFRGVAPSLIKAAPNSAITFATHEAVRNLVRQAQSEDTRGA